MGEAVLNYYRILGVTRYASERNIRLAYLAKVRHYHPDLHPQDPEAGPKMSAINVAYGTLSRPHLRARYDAPKVTITVGTAPPHGDPVSARRYPPYARRDPCAVDTIGSGFLEFLRCITTALIGGKPHPRARLHRARRA